MPFKLITLASCGFIRRQTVASQSCATPKSLPLDIPVDEETIPGYDPKNFYHPNPGDILDHRYKLKAKIGWGTSSTVWLAQDIRGWSKRYVAIKINDCRYASKEAARHELDISNRIAAASPHHRGRSILRAVVNSFEVASPNGSHLCLVFEPMREPLWLFRRRFGADKVTRPFLPIFKAYLRVLLEGLDYLHSECHIIHTDLKLDNILVTFEDQSVIESFVQGQVENPMARKLIDGWAVYLCHNDFGDFDGKPALRKMSPKITDFGLAERGDQPGPRINPIQPDHCHAPEVLLGTGWSYSADIWNFGIMVWDLLAGRELFQDRRNHSYSAQHHLAEMIALLGPPPKSLVVRERNMRHWRWSPEVRNHEGKLCNNAADFFGGPFFSDDGEFVRNDLIPFERNLSDAVPECVTDDDKSLFLNFMRRMLCWLPEDRATAKELKEDPWLDFAKKQ
ncbi:putative serine/threonine-protein kinase [Nemania diffusa]|nr:putative serine/threonine-protein kinase [Nemania diffusa]